MYYFQSMDKITFIKPNSVTKFYHTSIHTSKKSSFKELFDVVNYERTKMQLTESKVDTKVNFTNSLKFGEEKIGKKINLIKLCFSNHI